MRILMGLLFDGKTLADLDIEDRQYLEKLSESERCDLEARYIEEIKEEKSKSEVVEPNVSGEKIRKWANEFGDSFTPSAWLKRNLGSRRRAEDFCEHEIIKISYSYWQYAALTEDFLDRAMLRGKGSTFFDSLVPFIKMFNKWDEFRKIVHDIHKRISFDPVTRTEVFRFEVRGRVDWNGTTRGHIQRPWTPHPMDFHVVRPHRDFTLPENVLTVVAILKIRSDARRLLGMYGQFIRQQPEFRVLLFDVIESTRRMLRTVQFKEVIQEAERYLGKSLLSHEMADLERSAERSINRSKKKGHSYARLLDWWLKYKKTDFGYGGEREWAPRRMENKFYTKYELWVLLKLVEHVERNKAHGSTVRHFAEAQRETTMEFKSKLPIYEAETPLGRFIVEYQKDIRSWINKTYRPDFLVTVGGKKLIIDPKFYFSSSESVAVEAMMNYLGAFVCSKETEMHQNVQHAVAVFPRAGEESLKELLMTHGPRGTPRTIGKMRLIPDRSEEEANKKSLENLWDYIKTYVVASEKSAHFIGEQKIEASP